MERSFSGSDVHDQRNKGNTRGKQSLKAPDKYSPLSPIRGHPLGVGLYGTEKNSRFAFLALHLG